MKIAVQGNDQSFNELTKGNESIHFSRIESLENKETYSHADAIFILNDDIVLPASFNPGVPVFINSVSKTILEFNLPYPLVRINGWNGFLLRSAWEISGEINEQVHNILNSLQKKYIIIPDEPGFISARVIAMIINEAYLAKAEQVSTEQDIDIAMKLGTNYPYGPFEWGRMIGIPNVYTLLKKLSESNELYTPSSLLELEATNP
jgi:3-hydroxybutyryl-CoA dehydrogenase